MNYAHLVMEFGLQFKNFLDCIKTPNRKRMLRTLKLMMVTLKVNSNMCKYADKILRFLVLQLCALTDHVHQHKGAHGHIHTM